MESANGLGRSSAMPARMLTGTSRFLNCFRLLVGNKTDLVDKRVIETTDAAMFAETLNVHYIETSAKNATNVDEAFLYLAK